MFNLQTVINNSHLRLQAVHELLEVDHVVAIAVKALKQVDGVLLEGAVVLSGLLDLVDDVLKGGFGELVGVVFHVLLSVLVSRD